jgi:type I restriction enzyme S subunit
MWLQSSIIVELTWLEAVQSAQPNLSMGNLGNLLIPLPCIAEQHRIVKWLEDMLVTLNSVINQAFDGIKLFQEYRSALISAAVTGKIDVRGEMPEAFEEATAEANGHLAEVEAQASAATQEDLFGGQSG